MFHMLRKTIKSSSSENILKIEILEEIISIENKKGYLEIYNLVVKNIDKIQIKGVFDEELINMLISKDLQFK